MSTLRVDYDKIKNEILPPLKTHLIDVNHEISEYEHNPELMDGEGGRKRYYDLLNERYETQRSITYFERLLTSCQKNVNDVTNSLNDIHIDDLPTPNFTVQ